MTDEQIMLGLKWCYQAEGSCGDCPYRPDDIKKAKCHDRLGNDVIGLIERQKAEIERLEAEVETYETLAKDMHNKAITAFVMKLKIYVLNPNKDFYLMLDEIDNLVKEMGCSE